MSRLSDYFRSHAGEFEADLMRLLSIPSVSTDPQRAGEVHRCAEEVARQLRAAGLEEVRCEPTEGHPVVYAEWTGAPGRPTVLIYGHYDVQPEDPLEDWETPPFQPTVRDGKIYARGATDDKGQFLIHIKAVQGMLACHGELPVNIRFVLEGEEEVGSPHLAPWLRENRHRLAGDVLVISDTTLYAPGIPALVYGLRGLTYLEVEVRGADRDLHSGMFGGAVPNPAFELARMLAALKDSEGRVAVPGFYDQVRDLSSEERREFARLPFDEEAFRRSVGAPALDGERGYTPLERRWARPTLDINGVLSGFTGEGAKTVLPGRAVAKISCRLVPDQDPERIYRLLEEHLRRLAPPTVELTVKKMHGARPWLTTRDHPALQAACRAARRGFRAEPVFLREGGSIPIVADFEEILGSPEGDPPPSAPRLPAVLLGIGLPDEGAHAPNEHLDLSHFHAGIRTAACLQEELAVTPTRSRRWPSTT